MIKEEIKFEEIRFGKLKILNEVESYVSPSGQKKRKFNCLCECGNKVLVTLSNLKSKNTNSCGCIQKQIMNTIRKTHGLSRTRTYKSWECMKQRCYNPNCHGFRHWGGRGIKVCDRWLNSFHNFLEDMGERPEGTTIDRINNDGNYEPSNCRWSNKLEQNKNRRNNKK